MASQTQTSSITSPPSYTYVTAPTSPIEYSTDFYYSAPVSPRFNPTNPLTGGGPPVCPGGLDDFEFETSSKFSSGRLHFDPSYGGFFDYYGGQTGKIAFADELFLDGLVMPLKPPPRLLHDADTGGPSTTLCRLPFSKRAKWWNDDFDPFVAALRKVTEEKRRGRAGGPRQRRSRSYSPFRAVARCSSDFTGYTDRDFSEESGPARPGGPSFSGPLLDFKGSAYARWVRDQTGEGGLRPGKSPKRSFLGEKVRPVRNDRDGLEGLARNEERSMRKVQKVKEFLKKYAFFGRGSKGKGRKTGGSEKKKSTKYYNIGFKGKWSGLWEVKDGC